jgi:hypothetical protein
MSVIGNTNNATMTFTIQWQPDPGKNLMTDPPPATVNAVVTLTRQQGYVLRTGIIFGELSLKATSEVSADGVTFPVVQKEMQQINQMASFGTGSQETKVIHANPAVPMNGIVTLAVPLSVAARLDYNGPFNMFSNSVNSSLLVTLKVRDVVLTVPDSKMFPLLNPPADNRNKYSYDLATLGVLVNPAWVATVIGGTGAEFLGVTTFTSLSVGSDAGTAGAKTAAGNTITQQFTYTGLPENNSSFGNEEVTLVVNGNGVNTTQKANVQVFFAKYALNHPPVPANFKTLVGTNAIPNWYYYWRQTNAWYGDPYWGGNAGTTTGLTRYTAALGWHTIIYTQAGDFTGAGTWNNAEGIDLFANICRHEERHRLDMIGFWGVNSGIDSTRDIDDDHIPDNLEATLVPGHVYDNTVKATFFDTFDYGANPLPDNEDYCLRRQVSWTNGSANSVDWAYPGKQWSLF